MRKIKAAEILLLLGVCEQKKNRANKLWRIGVSMIVSGLVTMLFNVLLSKVYVG